MYTIFFNFLGDSYKSLMFLFRIGRSTISNIIGETVVAIYDALKDDYLKVSLLLLIENNVNIMHLL